MTEGARIKDHNYICARSIIGICKVATSAKEAETLVLSAYPWMDLSILRVMGCYYHKFHRARSRPQADGPLWK